MIEQYIYNKITEDSTLQTLLANGVGKYHLYPAVVPRGLTFTKAVTFTLITSADAFPNVKSVNVQFNIFAKTHSDVTAISTALANIFNDDNNQLSGGQGVVYSIRSSESDLGFDYDDNFYQREATYYFKLK